MSLWVVRAGRHGEQEETAINDGLVCHAWNELGDYSGLTRDALEEEYKKTYPRESKSQVAAGVSQVWRFAHDIKKGDLVALPLKSRSAFEFGRVTGDYEYKRVAPNVKHIRRVKWLLDSGNGTVPRSAFPQDILQSMNVPRTVFRVSRNDAEERVMKVLALAPLDSRAKIEAAEAKVEAPAEPAEEAEALDLADFARDEILKFIQANFKEHALAHLVAAILRAQGYKTDVSAPGPDGGVDILAGSGPLGFDHPRLCVQVKSGGDAERRATFDQILGVMSKFHCEQGLLVSWSGFSKPTISDARKDFFKVRLWDQGDIVDNLLDNYERLDEEVKADLPLKRIWITASEDEE
jgi:restriction system protein